MTQALLAGKRRFDLLLVYFGGTDVVGHRFRRHLYPEQFRHKPTAEEIEDLAGIIPDYYAYIDSVIGEILDTVPDDATIFIISDHGMRVINQNQHFIPDLPPVDVNSAEHQDGPPGIIIAAGTHLRTATASRQEIERLTWADIPTVGTVLDIAPTILALKGLPLGRDMDGVVLEDILEDGFLARHQLTWVETHDTQTWLAERPTQFVTSQMEQERIQQLKALGYLE